MQTLAINFGLVASEKFPEKARSRVLAPSRTGYCAAAQEDIAVAVLDALVLTGCYIIDWCVRDSTTEPTLVAVINYPVSDEKADCAPPSVLRYEKYMRLHEVACEFAQDAVAVLPFGEEGVLVGANTADWGVFDETQFIKLFDGKE